MLLENAVERRRIESMILVLILHYAVYVYSVVVDAIKQMRKFQISSAIVLRCGFITKIEVVKCSFNVVHILPFLLKLLAVLPINCKNC